MHKTAFQESARAELGALASRTLYMLCRAGKVVLTHGAAATLKIGVCRTLWFCS